MMANYWGKGLILFQFGKRNVFAEFFRICSSFSIGTYFNIFWHYSSLSLLVRFIAVTWVSNRQQVVWPEVASAVSIFILWMSPLPLYL